jgi:diguanylate cyclase (GGDEF)-like protein/PAS domain S-box-containing protein
MTEITNIHNNIADSPWRSIFKSSLALACCNSQWQITEITQGLATLLSFREDEIVGRSLDDVFELPGLRVMNGGQPLDLGLRTCRKANGSTLWVTLQTSPGEGGCFVQITDVSALIQERDEIAYKESIWRHAVQAAGHGVWEYNAITDMRFYSPEWRRIRGFPPEGEICDTIDLWEERLHPDDIEQVMEHVRAHNAGEIQRFAFEYRERRLDGEWIWILARGRAVAWDGNGIPTRLIGTDVDITSMKEEECRRAEDTAEAHRQHLAELAEAHAATEAARQVADIMARKDPLTSLPNRRVFAEEVSRRIGIEAGPDACCAVLLVDLDRFKPINDGLGHAAGDYVIRQAAARLEEASFEGVVVARMGGDEFGLVMPITDIANAQKQAVRQARALIEALGRPIPLGDIDADVGASIGIALYPDHGTDAETLMRHADIAMYNVKQNGRGYEQLYSPDVGRDAEARARLVADVRRAVAEEQIEPYFQPVIDLRTGAVSSFEVLARWTHPQFGPIAPDRFLPIIEQAGMMSQFSTYMLRRSCLAAADWPAHISIAVNISAEEVCDPALPLRVLAVLSDCDFPASRLGIEITEQALVKDFSRAKAVISALRKVGIKVLLDDFGTGYSGLGYLRELQFDCLKIDRSFIASVTKQQESEKIVDAIQVLAKNLNILTVAEGVEDGETVAMLGKMGCDLGQGYFFAKPMPKEEAGRLVSGKGSKRADSGRRGRHKGLRSFGNPSEECYAESA